MKRIELKYFFKAHFWLFAIAGLYMDRSEFCVDFVTYSLFA